MKRVLSLVLAVILLAGIAVPAFAAENETPVTPRYTYIARMYAGLSIGKLGVASCDANSHAPTADTMKLSCALQRSSGSGWTTVKTWTSSGVPSCAVSKSYAVYSGYTYRLKVTCSIYSSSGVLLESGTCYSNQVVY